MSWDLRRVQSNLQGQAAVDYVEAWGRRSTFFTTVKTTESLRVSHTEGSLTFRVQDLCVNHLMVGNVHTLEIGMADFALKIECTEQNDKFQNPEINVIWSSMVTEFSSSTRRISWPRNYLVSEVSS
jgi:hypothetical protein